jgi:hypothetical protein
MCWAASAAQEHGQCEDVLGLTDVTTGSGRDPPGAGRDQRPRPFPFGLVQPPHGSGDPRQHPPLPSGRLDPLADRHPPSLPAAFRKLDAVTVSTPRLLPAPQPGKTHPLEVLYSQACGLSRADGRLSSSPASRLSTARFAIARRVSTVADPRCGRSTAFSDASRPG